ncbi:nucleotide pyrophosphatase [Haloferax mediterranei ATCC 33500]|uniref:Nucleotide pyrophosphatase n=1 Tax=Haloferax mediterranei (strain ATCC 33500 / DSM 1411 / JCM 8866 / NBRC 14739 / NCIMB 2177 / R-4) TaxID=523841 RepID=I3R6G6_HALMT|nr:alkaline phosphatase family protein [Haloferax mediterranei]AFK19826.1 sulfatase arylsulfatase A-like protein [Haloferax mediterranei ATCC 33500]AHZ23208.1 nucleotide pyrophosphatase [Haloferax mediterranei ATCC 33500]ELZ99790.1 sulfatase [Haloferax mediterranei ATCC 33500]MDX5987426.1 alkaline phosphatase family protein [Haloferax mediterranei ATCC 33500]QCQ73929.1 nucleotide pyrophosphatase [Haloferax mediterranei ATCC 33500]
MGLFDRLTGGSDDPRVAFLGIDGVPYSLIDENPDVFPNLTRIASQGTGTPIDSIVPPESSACWPALTTGVNPGETGVFGFQDREPGSYDAYVPMGSHVEATRVWDRVTDAGRKATVMNVPVTFPPQRDVQRMVSGFLSPSVDKAAHPQSLADTLNEGNYRIDTDAKLGHKDDKSGFVENAEQTLKRRYEAFKRYIEQDDWDLFFGVFMTTDRVNHFLFKDYAEDGTYSEEFIEFYRTVDEYIGDLHDSLPEDVTLVVASDHGFTSLDYEVHCNTWLEENGWLTYQSEDHDSLGDIAAESKAYSLIPGRFFINLEGRDPRGSVPQDEYEEVRAELKAELEALEGPNGKKVADRVVTKEEGFHGAQDHLAPDLVIIPNHGFDLKSGFKGHDDVFGVGPRNGMHSFDNATLLIDDPEVSVSDDIDLYNITPTILDLMEIDTDATFEGRSLI